MIIALALAIVGAGCTEGRDPLDEARAHQEAGRNTEAIASLRAVLDKDPNQPEASYRLGLALIQGGKTTEAIFPLSRASESGEYASLARAILMATYAITKNHEEAIATADWILTDEPENLQALNQRLQSALELGLVEIASESLERLQQVSPDSDLRVLEARVLAANDEVEAAETVYREMLAGLNPLLEPGPWSRSCLNLLDFLDERERVEDSLQVAEECLAGTPGLEATIVSVADFHHANDRGDESLAILRDGYERVPDSGSIREALATQLLATDRFDEAVELAQQAADAAERSGRWLELARIQRLASRSTDALESFGTALELGLVEPEGESDVELIRFEWADTLLELGRQEEARQRLNDLTEPIYIRAIEARIALLDGDLEAARAGFDYVLERWPGNWGLRVLSARAAVQEGDQERAKQDLLEVTRAEPGASDAALWLARFHQADGEYRKAIVFSQRHIHERGTPDPLAHLVLARSLQALGAFDNARQVLGDLAERRDGEFAAIAMAEKARLAGIERTPAEALAELDRELAAGNVDLVTPEAAPLISVLAQLYIDIGAIARGRERLVELAERGDGNALAYALAGRLALVDEDLGAASTHVDRALELEPDLAEALATRGLLSNANGDEGAIDWMQRAADAAPDNPEYAYVVAGMHLARGDLIEGEERLEALLRIAPDHTGSANDLAWLLADRNEDLERAERLAAMALRGQPVPEVLDTAGYVQWRRGEPEKALALFKRAVTAEPDYGTAQFHMATVLAEQGEVELARKALERAVTKPFPELAEARTLLAKLDGGVQ